MKKTLPFLEKGGVLSDADIQLAFDTNYIKFRSRFAPLIQPSSVDIHLAPTIMTFARRRADSAVIDLKKPIDEFVDYELIDAKKGTALHPHEFILGVTEEWIGLTNQVSVNVDGKSSLGRLGLVVHATAGFVDPGYRGHITLEITNLTDMPLIIYPYMLIGQFRFTVLTSASKLSYGDPKLGSKYVNKYSKTPRPLPSQYWKNFLK